jgi:hypothetical protein
MNDITSESTAATGSAPAPSTTPPPADLAPVFPRLPGETPRAFSAFMAYFQLGQLRTHQAVADKLTEPLGTVKNWASKYNWTERLQEFHSGLLQAQAQAEADRQARRAADWAARRDRFREQEWETAQKLLQAAECYLESFGEEDLHKMTLIQVSRAISISSKLARSAFAGAELPPDQAPATSSAQQHFLDAISRAYAQQGQPDRSPSPAAVTL